MFMFLCHAYKTFLNFQNKNPIAVDMVEKEIVNEPEVPAPVTAGGSGLTAEDPLVVCRKPGQGRVQLAVGFNVWVDKAKLVWLQRWTDDSRRMTRELLRVLVGENNLKNMCARGNSKTGRRSIPEDIMTCIECKSNLFLFYYKFFYKGFNHLVLLKNLFITTSSDDHVISFFHHSNHFS